jgi:glycosyltransferase involved in cell wall biosynthesis
VKNTIAFVHSVAEIGGAERMSEALIDGLAEHAELAPLLVVPEAGPFSVHVAKKGCPVLVTDLPQPEFSSPLGTIRHAFKLAKQFKQANISLLQCADLVCTRSVLPAAKIAGIPVLCHMHFPVEAGYVNWVFKRMPKPAGFVYCSEELMHATQTPLANACPHASHDVIHNGVDIERFSPNLSSNTVPHVGIVANLQERKGHIDFLDMAKLLSDQQYNVHYDIIGGDILQAPRQSLLEDYASSLGIRDKVTFHGQVDNVLALLGKLDLLVCASHQEAFPVSILEAMAMQKAIVSTNVNGIPEAIVDEQCGILVPPHNPQALSDGVKRLLDNESLRQALADAARQRVVSEFSLQAYLDKFTRVYRRTLTGQK